MKLYHYFIFLFICEFYVISGTIISDKKCEEFSKLYDTKKSRTKREDSEDFFANFFDFPSAEKVATKPGEFPYMARIGYNDNKDRKIFLCGGALISDEYILTSATCTTTNIIFVNARRRREANESLDDVSLPINETLKWIQLGNSNSGIQEFTPEKIIVHPDYNNSIVNNIALVKLNKKIKFTEDIRPACLYSNEEDLTNKTVIGTGWGRTSFDSDFSEELMKVNLEIFSQTECKEAYEGFEIEFDEKNSMCVGHRLGSSTLCEGDGGAPFVIKNQNYNNMFDIVGILSNFYTCNLYDFPMNAAKLTNYISWIENIVWPN